MPPVRASKLPQGVRQHWQEGFEALLGALGAARKVHDKCLPSSTHHASAQHGHWRLCDAICPHRLRQSGGQSINDCESCLGNNIANAQPGPTRGHDEVDLLLVRPANESLLDDRALIGHDHVLRVSEIRRT
jgi:hypothetical protein